MGRNLYPYTGDIDTVYRAFSWVERNFKSFYKIQPATINYSVQRGINERTLHFHSLNHLCSLRFRKGDQFLPASSVSLVWFIMPSYEALGGPWDYRIVPNNYTCISMPGTSLITGATYNGDINWPHYWYDEKDPTLWHFGFFVKRDWRWGQARWFPIFLFNIDGHNRWFMGLDY